MWSSVVFYQTPGLEVTACMLLSTKAVYFVLHDGLRRYFSEPLQGKHQGLLAPGNLEPLPEEACWAPSLVPVVWHQAAVIWLHWTENPLSKKVGIKTTNFPPDTVMRDLRLGMKGPSKHVGTSHDEGLSSLCPLGSQWEAPVDSTARRSSYTRMHCS